MLQGEGALPLFGWEAVPRGVKQQSVLRVEAGGYSTDLPLLVVRGRTPGKTLLVSAGVHGDEYEGIQTVFEIYQQLSPESLSGSFIGLPVANPPAFWNGSRISPLDNGNLARVFPGSANGTITQAIAFAIDQMLFPVADFYLDLHSAGVMCEMPCMVGYSQSDAEAKDAAMALGMPVVWSHPTIAPGRTISSAIARGIPALYTEARGAGRIHEDDLRVYERAVRNLMKHLAIIPGDMEVGPEPLMLHGDGNLDVGMESKQAGFLVSSVRILDLVKRGQPLGRLVDLWGRTLEEFAAPRDGRVALIHACPQVRPGEPLFLVAGELPQSSA